MEGIVVIGGSTGGLDPLRQIIAALPVDCTAAMFVVMHIGSHPGTLPRVLTESGHHPAIFASDNSIIEAGNIYVAPPDHHMYLEMSRIRLSQGPKIHHTRPAVDPLFISAAEVYGQCVLGIVLSGNDGDGAAGVQAIMQHGGTVFVQDPYEAQIPSMPWSAIVAGHPNARLPVSEIAERVRLFCSQDWT